MKAHGFSFREVRFAPQVTEFEIGAPYIEICVTPFGLQGTPWWLQICLQRGHFSDNCFKGCSSVILWRGAKVVGLTISGGRNG